MSETRYTPEQMRSMDPVIDRLIDDTESHLEELEQGEREGFYTHNQQLDTNTRIQQLKEVKAMLRQAAPDAEQVEYQRRLIVSMEELLRSAHCIAARRGEGTHWDRFAASIQALGIGPVTARTYRVLPSDTEDNLPMADTEPNGVDVWLIKWAISNCHTLARRRIKAGSTDSDWWGHVLRLCEKAGAKSLGVLRVGECDALGQAATDAEALEEQRKAYELLRDEIDNRTAEKICHEDRVRGRGRWQ